MNIISSKFFSGLSGLFSRRLSNFWLVQLFISISLMFWTILGYPLFLIIYNQLNRFFSISKTTAASQFKKPFRVALVITAYNEEDNILEKIINSFNLNWSSENLEIIVASDGSSDRTDDLAGRFSGLKLYKSHARLGKSGLINDVMQSLSSDFDIVVLSDANTFYRPDTLNKLMAGFSDPEVGAVCGNLELTVEKSSSISSWEQLYWYYEHQLRKLESESGSTCGIVGSILAFRRSLFLPLPENSILDDLEIAVNIVSQGYRVIYEPEACGVEQMVNSSLQEWERKIRLSAGGLRLLRTMPKKLQAQGLYKFCLISHKVLRWLCAVYLLTIPLALYANRSRNKYFTILDLICRISLFLPVIEFLFNLIRQKSGYYSGIRVKKTSAVLYLELMVTASALGIIRNLTCQQPVAWKKTR